MPAALRSVVSSVDASLFNWVIAHRSSPLNQAMIILSYGGTLIWAISAVLLGLVFRGRWPGVFQVTLAIGLAALLADFAAKPVVARHRPFVSYTGFELMAKPQRSGSFPSTHAAGAFAGAFALSRVFPEMRAAVWIMAALVAFARVYVGVHYPLDAIGGVVIGLAAAAFAMGGTSWKKVGPAPDMRPAAGPQGSARIEELN
jgi:membrane-associated phospholipid phosphatase